MHNRDNLTQEQVIGDTYRWFLRLPPKSRARRCAQEVMANLRDSIARETRIAPERVQEIFEKDVADLPVWLVG